MLDYFEIRGAYMSNIKKRKAQRCSPMAPPSAQTTQRGPTQKVSLIVALVVYEIGGFWDQDNSKRSIS